MRFQKVTAASAFGRVADVPAEWTDPLTGERRAAGAGAAPDPLPRAVRAGTGSERQRAWLLGETPRPSRAALESEPAAPEVWDPRKSTRDADLAAARAFVGRGPHAADGGADDRGSDVKTGFQVTKAPNVALPTKANATAVATKGASTGGVHDADAASGMQVKLRVDAAANDAELRRETEAVLKSQIETLDLKDARLASYASTFVAAAAPAVVSAVPLEGETDRVANELVWAILTGHGKAAAAETGAAVGPLDSFLKQQVLSVAIRKAREQEAQTALAPATEASDAAQKQETLDTSVFTSASRPDVQFVVRAARTAELRADPVVQQRVGTWALQMLGPSVGVDKHAVRRGLKPEGLAALGRLALQVLADAAAAQRNDAGGRDALIADDTTRGSVAAQTQAALQKLAAVLKPETATHARAAATGFAGMQAPTTGRSVAAAQLLRDERFAADLQLMATFVPTDEAPDVVVGALLESMLADAPADVAKHVADVFAGLEAAGQENAEGGKQALVSSRGVGGSLDTAGAIGSDARRRQNDAAPQAPTVVRDTAAAAASFGSRRREPQGAAAFRIMSEISAEESVKQGTLISAESDSL